MASGAAGISTLLPPFIPTPTFGGGVGTEEAETPATSSQPTGLNVPAAKSPVEKQTEAADTTQPKEVTPSGGGGDQGIYTPKKTDFVSYDENSGMGGIQDLLNLYKSIHSNFRDPNQNQPNNGRSHQYDTSNFDYPVDQPADNLVTPGPDTSQSVFARAPSQVETNYPIGGLGGPGETPPSQSIFTRTPSQVEPNYPIGGAAGPTGGLNSFTGNATTFGLQPNALVNDDGTVDSKYFDPQDKGETAFGFNSRDPNLRGVSLPIDVIKQSIGDYTRNPQIFNAIKNGQYKVAVTNPQTGQVKIVNIVDAGPDQSTGNAIDVTYRTQIELGFNGKSPASFQIIAPDGSTIPLKGYRPNLVSNTPQPPQTTTPPKTEPPPGRNIAESMQITEAENKLPEESEEASGSLLPENTETQNFKEGGEAEGKVPGKGEGDKVPALLEPGEFVIKKEAVKEIGVDKLKEMNRMREGGEVKKRKATNYLKEYAG